MVMAERADLQDLEAICSSHVSAKAVHNPYGGGATFLPFLIFGEQYFYMVLQTIEQELRTQARILFPVSTREPDFVAFLIVVTRWRVVGGSKDRLSEESMDYRCAW